ncbi:MAG TPA: SRPBCC family protein [Euzebyales bacterium]|nr:SRPBCC family protein [Euzebyales bacterium]
MRLHATRVIARPADEVFAFLSDAANNPRWQRGMRSCAWTSPPPVGVGSTYRQRARFLGREVVSEFVVTAHEPGRSITIRSTGGSFPITVRRSVTPLSPGRSRVTAEIDGDPGRFFRLAGPVVRRLAQRSVDVDYDRLTRLLEGPGRAT